MDHARGHVAMTLTTQVPTTCPGTYPILIAFLAIVAYSEVWSRLAKGWSRRKDLETPNSPRIPIISPLNPPIEEKSLESLPVSRKIERMDQDLEKYKQLYHKLHNLEDYPDILPESRELLLSLLSSTITDALNANEQGILSVERFSRDGLSDFLKAKDVDVTNRWQEYLSRRKAGGSREIVSDKDEAKWWLKQAACVKYVDGAWLGHINKISTPFKYRHITKNAWQVMSEELGDGDLAKNHVHVYRELMKDIEAGLPAANLEDFVHPRQELTETRCWKAALAQLTISLFPHDFLPESLGFNMAYESLPLHLLKTVKELREVRLNPYYFELHISIDNADSGHAAMAMAAVINYIELVAKNDGKEAAHVAWKRVQAGYILAEGLPTTPESPSLRMKPSDTFPRTDTEAALIEIFAAKNVRWSTG
ncbi:ATPase components of ABC transporters with duplicated ATPase domains [Pyrenophora tritici-repentis Pt-1C-BFP]|uniref:ATPase components of ABC transporters with duplicated ATPase domains n=1 Tax=Pyrenophora tritici-repentis (strain Pt-1C-BFP) TaxID=426418 RepID=B2VSJ5_PYRTR|nr:ATPase components of ABC transporters with duplicated ATPase domains [Pyrenophora tritici-repentis Pt-1C-BFP]EDU40137.1 ATPase components of ABC transporters with duplicated ATPase domains [Pyrenophora tritici-repentis Pt-1C-BFP]